MILFYILKRWVTYTFFMFSLFVLAVQSYKKISKRNVLKRKSFSNKSFPIQCFSFLKHCFNRSPFPSTLHSLSIFRPFHFAFKNSTPVAFIYNATRIREECCQRGGIKKPATYDGRRKK